MEKIFYGLLLLLLVSCNSKIKEKKEESNLPVQDTILVVEDLHPTLVEGIKELVRSYPNIPLSESFIISIAFWRNQERANIDFSDSIVDVSYHTSYDEKTYKGMLNIDGYNVAIFDRDNFGDKYYNANSLKQISLDSFKRYSSETIPFIEYNIKNAEFVHWGRKVIVLKQE